ncbi:MAG: MraY family glycosyltransferase [bacterium]
MNFIEIPWQFLLGAFVMAFVVSSLATPLVIRWARARQLFDLPSPRRVHTIPVPRLGGIALILAIAIALMVVFGFDSRIYGLLIGAVLILGLGLLDDLYDLPPLVKLLGQICVAAIVVSFGITIGGTLTNPFGGVILIPPAVDALLTIGWILLVLNTVNWFDGLDGLVAGVSSIAAATLLILSLFAFIDQPETAAIAAIVLGAALGFLPYNWHPAKIFMGDSGSHLLGFMLAVLAIISGGKLATAALVLGLPIVDLFWAVIRRLRHGRLPWVADKQHLHHQLLGAGLGQRTVVIILYLLTAGFGAVALLSGTLAKLAGLLIVGLVMVIIIRLVLRFRPSQRLGS